MAGPRMVANWKMLEFQATAPWNCSSGTNCGRRARLAGILKLRTAPTRHKIAKIGATEPARWRYSTFSATSSSNAEEVANPT